MIYSTVGVIVEAYTLLEAVISTYLYIKYNKFQRIISSLDLSTIAPELSVIHEFLEPS